MQEVHVRGIACEDSYPYRRDSAATTDARSAHANKTCVISMMMVSVSHVHATDSYEMDAAVAVACAVFLCDVTTRRTKKGQRRRVWRNETVVVGVGQAATNITLSLVSGVGTRAKRVRDTICVCLCLNVTRFMICLAPNSVAITDTDRARARTVITTLEHHFNT